MGFENDRRRKMGGQRSGHIDGFAGDFAGGASHQPRGFPKVGRQIELRRGKNVFLFGEGPERVGIEHDPPRKGLTCLHDGTRRIVAPEPRPHDKTVGMRQDSLKALQFKRSRRGDG